MPRDLPDGSGSRSTNQKLMGKDGDRLQIIFITLDPERDTPAVLNAYVKTFDPSFVALYGTLEETAATAKEFGVFYEKSPADQPTRYPIRRRAMYTTSGEPYVLDCLTRFQHKSVQKICLPS